MDEAAGGLGDDDVAWVVDLGVGGDVGSQAFGKRKVWRVVVGV